MNLTDAWRRLRPNDHNVCWFGGGEERDLLDRPFCAISAPYPTSEEVREAQAALGADDAHFAAPTSEEVLSLGELDIIPPQRPTETRILVKQSAANPAPQEVVEALALAVNEAESWIHDQLDGTSSLDAALAELQPAIDVLNAIRGEATDAE